MKLFTSRICVLLVCVVLLGSPAVVLADGACSNMKIVHIGMSSIAPSGVEMWLKNESGTACGTVAANATAQYYLSTTNTDRSLAVLLTAASLKKNVWTYSVGSASPYLLAFVSIENVTD